MYYYIFKYNTNHVYIYIYYYKYKNNIIYSLLLFIIIIKYLIFSAILIHDNPLCPRDNINYVTPRL